MKPRRLQVLSCPPAEPAVAELWAALQARRCRPRYFATAPALAIGFRGPACVAVALVEAGGFRVEIMGRRWWLARLVGKAARDPHARAEAFRRAATAVAAAARPSRAPGGPPNLPDPGRNTDVATSPNARAPRLKADFP